MLSTNIMTDLKTVPWAESMGFFGLDSGFDSAQPADCARFSYFV